MGKKSKVFVNSINYNEQGKGFTEYGKKNVYLGMAKKKASKTTMLDQSTRESLIKSVNKAISEAYELRKVHSYYYNQIAQYFNKSEIKQRYKAKEPVLQVAGYVKNSTDKDIIENDTKLINLYNKLLAVRVSSTKFINKDGDEVVQYAHDKSFMVRLRGFKEQAKQEAKELKIKFDDYLNLLNNEKEFWSLYNAENQASTYKIANGIIITNPEDLNSNKFLDLKDIAHMLNSDDSSDRFNALNYATQANEGTHRRTDFYSMQKELEQQRYKEEKDAFNNSPLSKELIIRNDNRRKPIK